MSNNRPDIQPSLIVKLRPDIQATQHILSSPPDPNRHVRRSTRSTPKRAADNGNINRQTKKRRSGTAKKAQNVPYYGNATTTKPDPHGKPTVWADKRQQLCETLPYYKAYQSGAYTNSGILYGFLIDSEVGILDKFDDQIVITTIGGDRKKDDQGQMVQQEGRDDKACARAAQKSMKTSHPVAVIAGQGNRISPIQLPRYYNVLDWFKVTDVWRETSLKTWKIRFEKINLTERSWWAAKGTYPAGMDPLVPDFQSPKAIEHTCGQCQRLSKEIYEQGWTCLEPQCGQYFKFGGNEVHPTELTYSTAFLKERSQYNGEEPGPLEPPLPTDQGLNATGTTTPYDTKFKAGIVCPRCGCCSRRRHWNQWACENPGCNFTHSLTLRPINVYKAIAEGAVGPRVLAEKIGEDTTTQNMKAGLYNIREFILPGPGNAIAGYVRHFKANALINQQPSGPDDLFRDFQEEDFKLTRNPTRNKGLPSEILTSHYASNWGALYKYSVSPITTGFSDAPPAVLKAVKRLSWVGKYAVEDNNNDFNELLIIGYNEMSKMDYHDDGESTLGPTVATLSLGARSTLRFRPKKNSPMGTASGNSKGTKPDCLKITLEHGDLLVMHGTDIQKHYEHKAEPHGKLRFALTARFIIPERMGNADDREFAYRGGIFPEGHNQYNYDGDVNMADRELARGEGVLPEAHEHSYNGNIGADILPQGESQHEYTCGGDDNGGMLAGGIEQYNYGGDYDGDILPNDHEQYDYNGDIDAQPVAFLDTKDIIFDIFQNMFQQGRFTALQAERLLASVENILNE